MVGAVRDCGHADRCQRHYLDWAFSRANGQNWEFELRKGLLGALVDKKREGAVRVLSYVNHAHMGDYRESVQQYLAERSLRPTSRRANETAK